MWKLTRQRKLKILIKTPGYPVASYPQPALEPIGTEMRINRLLVANINGIKWSGLRKLKINLKIMEPMDTLGGKCEIQVDNE